MRPLPPRFLGQNGIPCVFAVDDSGNTAIGHFIKQLGPYKFVATDGSVRKIVRLAQNAADVADLNHLPVGTCTILVEQFGGEPQHIRRITEFRCTTTEGNVFPWHPAAPTPQIAGILEPVLTEGPPLGIGLENGDFWMLEPDAGFIEGRFGLNINYRGYYLGEVPGYFELMQDGSHIDFEDDSGSLLLETAP